MTVLATSNRINTWLVGYLGKATWDVEKIQKRLLTGEREDDRVRSGMADSLDVKAMTGSAAINNLNDGISYLNIADAALEAVQGIMSDLRSVVNSAEASTSATERSQFSSEANALIEQANEIIANATFGDSSIFFGESTQISFTTGQGKQGSFQVAIGGGESLTYAAVDLSLAGDPSAELVRLESFDEELEKRRGTINAGRSRATVATAYLGVMVGLYEESALDMRLVDEAEEISALEEAQAKQDAISNLLLNHLSRQEGLIGQIYGSIRSWTA